MYSTSVAVDGRLTSKRIVFVAPEFVTGTAKYVYMPPPTPSLCRKSYKFTEPAQSKTFSPVLSEEPRFLVLGQRWLCQNLKGIRPRTEQCHWRSEGTGRRGTSHRGSPLLLETTCAGDKPSKFCQAPCPYVTAGTSLSATSFKGKCIESAPLPLSPHPARRISYIKPATLPNVVGQYHHVHLLVYWWTIR